MTEQELLNTIIDLQERLQAQASTICALQQAHDEKTAWIARMVVQRQRARQAFQRDDLYRRVSADTARAMLEHLEPATSDKVTFA